MKEYWVNVYEHGNGINEYRSRLKAELGARNCLPVLYRIHVKMKEPKPIDKQIPVKLDYTALKKYHWMDN